MTPTWLATWPVDNPMLFSIIILIALVASVVVLQLTLHQQWATAAGAIVVPLALTVVLNHVLAESRQREDRRWNLRQEHVGRLKLALRADAGKLEEVAERTEMQGLPMLSTHYNPGSRKNEMDLRFSPDPLSDDVGNHHKEYADKKKRLRLDVEGQDKEYAALVSRLAKTVELAPGHPYRENVARAYIMRCLGIGPGMTLTVDDRSHSYSWLGGSSGGSGPPPAQVVEAYRAFTALQSAEGQFRAPCMALKDRAARIVKTGKALSAEARTLAERTTIEGDCQYTTLH